MIGKLWFLYYISKVKKKSRKKLSEKKFVHPLLGNKNFSTLEGIVVNILQLCSGLINEKSSGLVPSRTL